MSVGVFETGREGDLGAGAVAGAVGGEGVGISSAELFGAAGAVDHAGPETVKGLFIEVAPAISGIEADEEGAAGADELGGKEDVVAVFVAHAGVGVAGEDGGAGFGAGDGVVPEHAGEGGEDTVVFFGLVGELEDGIGVAFGGDLEIPGAFGAELGGDIGAEEAGLGDDGEKGEKGGVGVVGAVEEVLGEAFSGDVDESAAGLADEIGDHLGELFGPEFGVGIVENDAVKLVEFIGGRGRRLMREVPNCS